MTWHEARLAGRVQRHVAMLRQIARVISADPERQDRPASGRDAESRLWEYFGQLEESTSRRGLSAATGAFIDHVVGVATRYGRNLFHCFDDLRIPATTNELEGFFGASKRTLRSSLGRSSTTGAVTQNLPEDFLLTFAQVKAASPDQLRKQILSVPHEHYVAARQEIDQSEQPARKRRSVMRRFDDYLDDLLNAWEQDQPPP